VNFIWIRGQARLGQARLGLGIKITVECGRTTCTYEAGMERPLFLDALEQSHTNCYVTSRRFCCLFVEIVCIVLYCIVLYCIVLYCMFRRTDRYRVLYVPVLYCMLFTYFPFRLSCLRGKQLG